ncbi:hypothetical protein FRX31_034686 [Thalictrum thalictroides]|uniref:Uncharacterized protein n=1 Tax=Thalictrum thalictroides TaxID=46969 RepID=A0A7J6UTF1_THATH|nr:hypothetical protein FRX31_034686 [Thalictrum thalictroides]
MTSTIEKSTHHARSISLPSSISHPLTLQVEEQLCRLRSSELATTSSSSISHNLASLKDLYECVDDVLQLSLSRQSLSGRVLDGSLILLDVCGTVRDTLSQMKQSLQDLQSSLRRGCSESGVAVNLCAYMTSRKKGIKVIKKCIADIKKMGKTSAPYDKDNNMINILLEMETITQAVFESLLSYMIGAKAGSKQSKLSLVSKFKRSKSCNADVKDIKPLEELEMTIQGFEDGLELLFRPMIKFRVSLLNILNQL